MEGEVGEVEDLQASELGSWKWQHGQLLLERCPFQQCDAAQSLNISMLLQQSCITIVMRAAEKDLAAVVVVKI